MYHFLLHEIFHTQCSEGHTKYFKLYLMQPLTDCYVATEPWGKYYGNAYEVTLFL